MVSSAPDSRDAPAPASLEGEAELARLRAAHQDLLRAISHDLRAPLRHITAFAPLLREILEPAALSPPEREEALEFLATMENAGQRMGRMIDALLALSRIEAAPLRIESVDMQRLLAQVLDEVRSAAQGREIDWRIPPELPHLQVDVNLLRLALRELLANAIKFTRHCPEPRIRVSCARGESGGWALSVQDNGVGFDMAQSRGLFGLFQRLHPERAFEGVGGGLALVSAVAARLGGSVGAHAVSGEGCTVTLQWPDER